MTSGDFFGQKAGEIYFSGLASLYDMHHIQTDILNFSVEVFVSVIYLKYRGIRVSP